MVNLNMIDTIGSGIRRMFALQRERLFPLPDYNLEEPERVKVRIFGRILDDNYSRLLKLRPDLDLLDVIALDQVQKGRIPADKAVKSLRKKGLIEGRRPNLYVSASVADATDAQAEFLRNRALEEQHYRRLILDYLSQFGPAPKQKFEELLGDKLSDTLDDDQRANFVKNLLQKMRRDGEIRPVEGKRGVGAQWELSAPRPDGIQDTPI